MVKSLREGVMKDILDAGESIVSDFRKNKRSHSSTSLKVSSISRASKDLVMSFPVLCDDSIDPKTAAMICKAIERKCVSMLQMIFASCSFNADSGRDVIAQWHNNIDDSNYTLDDYLDLCDQLSDESYINSAAGKKAINEAVAQMKAEMKVSGKVYPSSVSESSINDYRVSTRHGQIMITEARRDYPSDVDQSIINKNDAAVRNSDAQAAKAKAQAKYADAQTKYADAQTKYADAQTRSADAQADYYKSKQSQLATDSNRNTAQSLYSAARQRYQDNISGTKDRGEMLSKQLLDSDVKKCNELVPSLMIVRFNAPLPDSKDVVVTSEFIAGVKARLISVDSYEIIDRIVSKNKDRSGLTNLIRATTKEISFVKDYLLAIDKAKMDAKNNSIKNKSSRIWKTLEKRSTKSVLKRLLGRTNDAGCITTLVISAEVANMLKKEYGINIANVKTASTIMDAYNLLALVIVDESTEVARFLFDGDSTYEDLSFNSLERESGDGSYKKVINLLSKTAGVGR